jgi:hypothetical protein
MKEQNVDDNRASVSASGTPAIDQGRTAGMIGAKYDDQIVGDKKPRRTGQPFRKAEETRG